MSTAVVQNEQAPVAAPATTETQPEVIEPVEAPETKDEAEADAPIVPAVVAAESTAEPVVEVTKQPTTTHAQLGNAHTDAEPATQVDGTKAPAPEVAESSETKESTTDAPAVKTVDESKSIEVKKDDEAKKEEKKVATKEKIEKTKSEGKGFFAKFFGGSKSPKKEKKVKTPKTEKTEAAATAPAETVPPAGATSVEAEGQTHVAGETTETTATPVEKKSEMNGTGIRADQPAAPEDASAVPAAESSKPFAAEAMEPEPVKETEITPATVPAVEPVPVPEPQATQDVPAATASEATAASAEKHDEHPKGLKAGRRLSSRLISGLKNFGKKDHVAKEDKREPTEPKHEESTPTTVVSDEAPRLGQPMLAEPIRIEEQSTETKPAAPPAAPVVSATA